MSGSAEAEIRGLEDQRFAALLDSDLERFASFCHNELVYIHSNGSIDSLESYIRQVREGYYDYRRIEHPVDRVIVVGDTAIVVGAMEADLFVGGKPVRLDNHSLATWVRVNGEWKLISYQPTPKGPAASPENASE